MTTSDGRVIAIPADSPMIKAPDRPAGFDTQLAPSMADAILMQGYGILLKGASSVAARLVGVSGEGFVPGVAGASAEVRFASDAQLLSHFEKHGVEFGARSADEYMQVGRDIMQSGQKIEYIYKGETRTGYVQLMGNTSRGDAKFGFVGTNADGVITTIHTQSGNSFWKLLNGPSADKIIRPIP